MPFVTFVQKLSSPLQTHDSKISRYIIEMEVIHFNHLPYQKRTLNRQHLSCESYGKVSLSKNSKSPIGYIFLTGFHFTATVAEVSDVIFVVQKEFAESTRPIIKHGGGLAQWRREARARQVK